MTWTNRDNGFLTSGTDRFVDADTREAVLTVTDPQGKLVFELHYKCKRIVPVPPNAK